jgi:hypothetical protein
LPEDKEQLPHAMESLEVLRDLFQMQVETERDSADFSERHSVEWTPEINLVFWDIFKSFCLVVAPEILTGTNGQLREIYKNEATGDEFYLTEPLRERYTEWSRFLTSYNAAKKQAEGRPGAKVVVICYHTRQESDLESYYKFVAAVLEDKPGKEVNYLDSQAVLNRIALVPELIPDKLSFGNAQVYLPENSPLSTVEFLKPGTLHKYEVASIQLLRRDLLAQLNGFFYQDDEIVNIAHIDRAGYKPAETHQYANRQMAMSRGGNIARLVFEDGRPVIELYDAKAGNTVKICLKLKTPINYLELLDDNTIAATCAAPPDIGSAWIRIIRYNERKLTDDHNNSFCFNRLPKQISNSRYERLLHNQAQLRVKVLAVQGMLFVLGLDFIETGNNVLIGVGQAPDHAELERKHGAQTQSLSEVKFNQAGNWDGATHMCASADEKFVAFGYAGGKVVIYHLSDLSEPFSTINLDRDIQRITFAPEGRRIAVLFQDNSIQVLHLGRNRTPMLKMPAEEEMLTSHGAANNSSR